MAEYIEVEVEPGLTVRVRPLGLFELEDKVPLSEEATEPFYYRVRMVDGETYDVAYDASSLATSVPKPKVDKDKVSEGDPEYYEWLDY